MDRIKDVEDIVLSSESPWLRGTDKATEEEQTDYHSIRITRDVDGVNPNGPPAIDTVARENGSLCCSKIFKLGIGNINDLILGKLNIVKDKMNRITLIY